MPIIDLVHPDAPLGQGNILTGISLFVTKESWLEKGGDPAKAPSKMCLVLSRPCVLAHKRNIVVAGIDKFPDAVPKHLESLEDVVDFLTTARDGMQSPDVFYLGQLPGLTGRW